MTPAIRIGLLCGVRLLLGTFAGVHGSGLDLEGGSLTRAE